MARGPFDAPWLNGALAEAFGAPLDRLSVDEGAAKANEAVGANATTEGRQMSFSDTVGHDPDAATLETVAHETAHALAGGGSGKTLLDQPGDPGEAAAVEAGRAFSAWVRGGMEGPAPALRPANGGQAKIHREASSSVVSVTGTPMLRRGSRGAQVRALQTLLNAKGSNLVVDGVFGPAVHRAVRAFQATEGLTADGVVGPRTASRLNTGTWTPHPLAEARVPVAPVGAVDVSGSPVLRRGSRGSDVRALQQALNRHGASISVDGVFGRGTAAAVRSFQIQQGLAVDGLVGPSTAARLNGAVAGGVEAIVAPPMPVTEEPVSQRLTGSPPLRQGDRGDRVEELQRRLNAHGGNLRVDGVFGPGTAMLLRDFQRANGLSGDAVVGPRTAEMLYRSNAQPVPESGSRNDAGIAPAPGSTDVADADPRGVLRDSRLNPEVREIARKTALDLQAEGLRPYIFEGYRSFARQNELYDSGRGVTQVRAGGSWHNYGLAIDIIFYDSRGNPSWGAPMADWRRVGALGKANGATAWGGDWGWDNPHLEYHPDWTGSAYDLADIYHSQGITAVWDRVGA